MTERVKTSLFLIALIGSAVIKCKGDFFSHSVS